MRLPEHNAVSEVESGFNYRSKGAVTSQPPFSVFLHSQKPAGQRAASVGEYDSRELLFEDVFLKKSHKPGVTTNAPVHDVTP